ncbi:MAG TPA: hypothetical protein VKV77_02220 [Methylovirgula sp.]|nr:hypothetical protein [Methylovirgula sp.]
MHRSIGLAVSVPILLASALSAQSAHWHRPYTYAACTCHYGYPGDFCAPVVSCVNEGGRCVKSCVLPPQSGYCAGDE